MGWFWPAATAALAVDGLHLRSRLAALDVLEEVDSPVDSCHHLIVAHGVTVDDATARAASAHARRHGLEVVDLVPADLPVERLLDLLRMVDPATFRDDALAPGRGAFQALLVTEGVALRAGITGFGARDTGGMIEVTGRLKQYAPRTMAHALAPSLAAGPEGPGTRLDILQRTMGGGMTTAGVALDSALLAGAARSRRPWALAAAATRQLAPWVAVAGTAAQPRDLAAWPARLVSAFRNLPAAVGAWASTEAVDARRPEYDALLAGGVDRFFEPRRADCPLCGSTDLEVRVETGDLLQCKPGTFTLEECGACRHIFQNPQLNAEGLDFYYRDFYDGAHADAMEATLSRFRPFYTARAEMLRPYTTPERWLDVGSGHGHFCLMARTTWPDTTFDGLDMSDNIVEAERRGWVDTSYYGSFPDQAGELAGRYDVVSMFHYLEHTPEPTAQLDAAATVLGPGGMLLIEVPDPESRLADVLGRYWPLWGQPQHLHFVSVGNLASLLEARGFEVVEVVRGPARIGMDFVGAALEVANDVQPAVALPWHPPPTPAERAKRVAALTAIAPVMAATVAVEVALTPLGGRLGTSNAYRLLARRKPL